MPTRAPRACSRPACPHVQPCPLHARRSWDHGSRSRQERGYGRLREPVACEQGRGEHKTWDSLRACVLQRDGLVCAYCRGRANTADHRVAKAHGGMDVESNLVSACRTCHQRKSSCEGNVGRATS